MLVGALLIFIGVALFASQLVRPLADVLGWPAARLGGAAGVLARDNAQRNPQRTASTAAALMIGLALVTLVATLAAGIIKPFQDAVDELFTSDYAITAQNNFDPIPPSAAERGRKAPGVEAIASVRGGDGYVFPAPGQGDPGHRRRAADEPGDHAQVARRVAVDDRQSRRERRGRQQGLREGSRPRGRLPDPVTHSDRRAVLVHVKGIFAPPTGGSPFGTVTISSATFDAHWQQPLNLFTFVKMRGGVTDANTAALKTALEGVPEREGADAHRSSRTTRSGASSRCSTSSTCCSRSRS